MARLKSCSERHCLFFHTAYKFRYVWCPFLLIMSKKTLKTYGKIFWTYNIHVYFIHLWASEWSLISSRILEKFIILQVITHFKYDRLQKHFHLKEMSFIPYTEEVVNTFLIPLNCVSYVRHASYTLPHKASCHPLITRASAAQNVWANTFPVMFPHLQSSRPSRIYH